MSSATMTNGHLKQRRARSQLSCTNCRGQKLKCNRSKPCDQCIKRSRDDSCEYLPPAQKSKTTQNVRSRIQHLEKLVVDLMNANQKEGSSASPSSKEQSLVGTASSSAANALTPPDDSTFGSEVDTESSAALDGTFGRLRIDRDKAKYVHGYHWSAILNSISEFKQEYDDDDDSIDEDHDELELDGDDDSPPGISNLLRSPVRLSRSQLLQALPSRTEVDRLVYQWFSAADPFKYVLHPPTFQATYHKFWEDPSTVTTMWIAQLYALMSLSASYPYQQHVDPTSEEAVAMLKDSVRYHELSASAAVLADYLTPKAYVLEFLHLYIGGLRTNNSYVDIWQLMGLTLRLAQRMGYHRDGSLFPHLSIFEQEMRRRVWWSVWMLDGLISFTLGLPSVTSSINCDTKFPSNLQDSELLPDITQLPPSRPLEELCSITYVCVKIPYSRLFATITQTADGTKPRSIEEVMLLDNKLEAVHEATPSRIKIKPFDHFLGESFETIMWTFNLELLYLKTRIVLHRPFMVSTATEPAALLSRRKCVDSAMQILAHHQDIYAASRRGGQLEYARQYMGSITTNDFLLAAMILCLELSQHLDGTNGASPPAQPEARLDHSRMIELLKATQTIWTTDNPHDHYALLEDSTYKRSTMPRATRRVARALGAMIARAEAQNQMNRATGLSTSSAADPFSITPAALDPPMPDVDMLRWGAGGPAMPWRQQAPELPTNAPAPNEAIIDEIITNTDIDWSTWDQLVGAGVGAMPTASDTFPWDTTW